MESSELEDLCSYFNTKISNIKKYLQLRKIGKDQWLKSVLHKIAKDMMIVHDLLSNMEIEVKQQEKLKNSLEELQKVSERDKNEAQHLSEHIPTYLPKPTQHCIVVPTVKHEKQTKVKPGPAKKPAKEKIVIKEIALITAEEFADVPVYLKGRLTYDQINAVVQELNKAVVRKYKIMHQPLKFMNFATRNLYQRFTEDENKHTKGEFFIVEADIKEFTPMKVDKRFHSILSILRHCRRVREVRGSRLIRYVI
ncbi:SKA1 protein, partial [Furnarius figulus]|nr:SKA1 protein [Furnarius figulus]